MCPGTRFRTASFPRDQAPATVRHYADVPPAIQPRRLTSARKLGVRVGLVSGATVTTVGFGAGSRRGGATPNETPKSPPFASAQSRC